MSEKMCNIGVTAALLRAEYGEKRERSEACKALAMQIAALQREAEVMTLALNYALPIVEKYAHTQGDNAAFHAKITAPIRAALNEPPQQPATEGSDRD
jgi:quinolinate synthase